MEDFRPSVLTKDVVSPLKAHPLDHSSSLPRSKSFSAGNAHRHLYCSADQTRPPTISKSPSLSLHNLPVHSTHFSYPYPPLEPKPDFELPLPPPSSKPPYTALASTHLQYISSSPLSPSSFSPHPHRTPPSPLLGRSTDFHNQPSLESLSPSSPHMSNCKGKAPISAISPPRSPPLSPRNSFDRDFNLLLNHVSLKLQHLTVHHPNRSPSPHINPKSAANITVRRKEKRGSKHFRGRKGRQDPLIRGLSLIDIPVTEIAVAEKSKNRPLRGCRPYDSPHD